MQNSEPAYSESYRSVDGVIDLFLGFGCPKHKMSVAIRPFGSTFNRVSSSSPTTPGSPALGPSSSLIYPENVIQTPSMNTLIHLQDNKTVCRVVEDPKWTKNFDIVQKVPYAYNDVFWLSFDDFESYKVKV